MIVSASDVFVVGNTVEFNGTDPGACYDSSWGGVSQKHCHGIYMSDFSCTGMADITIRGNVFSNHGGRGIQWNGAGCDTEMVNTLVENNLIENNSWGMAVYYNVRGSIITNNTFILNSYPATSDTDHFIIGVWGSRDNVFNNNILYSTKGDVGALVTDSNSDQNTFDYNLWKVTSNQWYWKGSWRNDFKTNYRNLSGWDSNGQCCNVDPGFYNVTNGIYHLVANSLARDKGQNSSCAFIDIDNENRLDLACDIGMDEYNE